MTRAETHSPEPRPGSNSTQSCDLEERTEQISDDETPPRELFQFGLVVCSSEGVQVHPLTADEPIVVGRRPPSNVAIPHRSLSRLHAKFELRGQEVWVEDLGSTNGTIVNGMKTQKARLTPRD